MLWRVSQSGIIFSVIFNDLKSVALTAHFLFAEHILIIFCAYKFSLAMLSTMQLSTACLHCLHHQQDLNLMFWRSTNKVKWTIFLFVFTYFYVILIFLYRFHINLQTDDGDDPSNVSFHFNPRQSQDEVIRNSMVDGGWGDEEKDAEFFPFAPKQSFEIRIICTAWNYVVSIVFYLWSQRCSYWDVMRTWPFGEDFGTHSYC